MEKNMVYKSKIDKGIFIFPILYVVISILVRLLCGELSYGTIGTVMILWIKRSNRKECEVSKCNMK